MGGRAAGFRPAVAGGVGLLSPGSDSQTDCPDFGRTALRSPMVVLICARSEHSTITDRFGVRGDRIVRSSFGGGNVDERLREKLVDALEKSFRAVGAADYGSGIEQARKLIAFASDGIESIKTADDLRTALDSCSPLKKREELMCLLLAQSLPGLLRLGLKLAAKKAASDLPPLNNGRPPALSRMQAKEAIDYVSKLHRSGCQFEAAKFRTAQKFQCSLRTIERLWKERSRYLEDPSEHITLDDALRFIASEEGR